MRNRPGRKFRAPLLAGSFCLAALLNACATYQPKPLADQSPLASNVAALSADSNRFGDNGMPPYILDPARPLDLTGIGILAALNNPELRVQRTRWKLAGAQVFAAGLLPDPTLAMGVDRPLGHASDLVNPWLVDVGYDIVPLITRQARIDAAHAGQTRVYLELLWQEWQVIQQARSMAVRLQFERKQLALLEDMRGLYEQRYVRSAEAMKGGDVTLDVAGTDLTALVTTTSQIGQMEQSLNETRHALNLLLGLEPGIVVQIDDLAPPSQLGAGVLSAQLARVSEIRPDILALRAGYASQEANLRAAILAQFPSIGISVNRARDSGDVNTAGLSISLSLPLFSGNRGNIAVERATREILAREYEARLAGTETDVDRLVQLQKILQQHDRELANYLPELKDMVDQSRVAYQQGDIDAVTFLNMESTWVNQRLEQINLVQLMWENRIALETLLALPGLPSKPVTELPQKDGIE